MEVLVLSDLHTHHNVEPLAIAVDEAGASLNLMQIAGSAPWTPVVTGGGRGHAGRRPGDRAHGPTPPIPTRASGRPRAGVGVIVLPESHQPDFFLAEGWEADFDALRPQIEGLADALTRADTAGSRARSAPMYA